MIHIIPYEAEFECEKGHRFMADCSPDIVGAPPQQVRCPQCFEDWIEANVGKGTQVNKAEQKRPERQLT